MNQEKIKGVKIVWISILKKSMGNFEIINLGIKRV